MACRDWDGIASTVTVENPETKRKLDVAVKLLCAVCLEIEKERFFKLDRIEGLSHWWEKHQIMDMKRKQEEEKIKKKQNLVLNALAKLTKEEIQALGLKKCK